MGPGLATVGVTRLADAVAGSGDRVLVSECEEVLGFWRRRRSWIIGDMGSGGEGNGGWCWVWWLLGNMGLECGGFGSRSGRATFSAIGEREREREIGLKL